MPYRIQIHTTYNAGSSNLALSIVRRGHIDLYLVLSSLVLFVIVPSHVIYMLLLPPSSHLMRLKIIGSWLMDWKGCVVCCDRVVAIIFFDASIVSLWRYKIFTFMTVWHRQHLLQSVWIWMGLHVTYDPYYIYLHNSNRLL